ncbi:unnamed protein product [Plutella xylostella]|uniref:(diamondback moth) hypothetical protein n=1 Tax=Plutella xylostella TaxID=51655 RepID=A0A8S4G5D2_PLUXY|nr:unnamed protein product [Plutella xylostella]
MAPGEAAAARQGKKTFNAKPRPPRKGRYHAFPSGGDGQPHSPVTTSIRAPRSEGRAWIVVLKIRNAAELCQCV